MGNSNVLVLVGVGFGIALGLTLVILGCVLGPGANFWPFLGFMFLLVMPFPFLLCPANQDSFSTALSGREVLGNFVVGAMLCSIFALPLVQWHIWAITGQACGLAIGGFLTMFVTGVLYSVYMGKKNSSGF